MSDSHSAHWPPHLPRELSIPATDLFYNLEVSARRFPDKPAVVYYDSAITYRRFLDDVECIAGWLQRHGVARGDRMLLYLQNSPQFMIGYYAILRANAVVVPVNPMNRSGELLHYVRDSGATIALAGQELLEQIVPMLGEGLQHLLLAAYSDYAHATTDLAVPDVVREPRSGATQPAVTLWSDALAERRVPGPVTVGPQDLAVLPYTSGTTGHPKGVMHTHRSVMSNLQGCVQWFGTSQDAVCLCALPLFHVTGMQFSMNGPLFAGATIVVMTRWDRDVAARCIERYRIDRWTAIPTMLIDFLGNPDLGRYDLSSLRVLAGGGAAMPEAIAQRLLDMGLQYYEGYGLTETIAQSHLNPVQRPRKQCLGIPVFGTEAMIVDPETLRALPDGETGEILVRGPQVFTGYWKNPEATRDAFVDIDGKRWFRTGDLAYVDVDGYFFMVDRLKRMINAAGFKVWPAEVEAMLYQHPAVHEACIIAARDPRRGETVKAVIVLKESHRASTRAQDIIDWAHGRMATYKAPRIVEFVDALPKTATGKILWRTVQQQESTRDDDDSRATGA